MQAENVIHQIRQKLQVIESTQELATLESRRWHEKIIGNREKIDRLLSQLEAMTCPLEKECPRIGRKGDA